MSINTRNKISAALGFARTFAAALAACAVISSCEIFHADNPSQIGSITMRLPSAEQMSAASGGAFAINLPKAADIVIDDTGVLYGN